MRARCVTVAAALLLAAAAAGGDDPAGSAAGLARALLAETDPGRRTALLESQPALLGKPLRLALVDEGSERRRRGDLPGSLVAFALARTAAARGGDRAGEAVALNQTGQTLASRGDYPDALEALRGAETVAREVKDTAVLAASLNGQGIVHRRQGDLDDALRLFREAFALNEGAGDRAAAGRVLNNIGIVHGERGDLRQALEALERGLDYKAGDEAGIASALMNIGLIHDYQGELDLALDYYRRSLAIAERLGNAETRVNALVNIGSVLVLQGRRTEARQALEAAVVLAEKSGGQLAGALQELADVALSEGAAAEAEQLLGRSLEIARRGEDWPLASASLSRLARALSARGARAEALAAAREAVALAERVGIPREQIRSQTVLGDVYRSLGQRGEARQAYQAAAGAIERARQQVAGGELERQRFFAQHLAPYQALVGLQLEDGDAEGAWRWAERARARVLVEVLQRGRTRVTTAMTAAERDEERTLERGLLAAQGDAVAEARRALEAFRARLYAAHPELPMARGESEPASIQDAGQLVSSEGAAVLMYTVGEDRTHLLILAAENGTPRLTGQTLDLTRRDLTARVERFRQALASRDLEALGQGLALHRALVAPAAARLRGRSRLYVVPDGPLWELPFAALVPRAGRFLIDDFTLASAPSLTALQALRAARRAPAAPPRPGSLLAMGNPTLARGPGALPPLPQAEGQVRALGRLYGPARSAVFVGPQASEGRAKVETVRHSILHFATHGVLDDASPMYSALLLAAEPPGADEDGRLEARELMQLPLSADLAVLSACETARGRVGAGEGMIGLSWALLMAGTANVVVSQWRVDADSTEALMVGFHRRLRQPAGPAADVAEALRRAALAVKAEPRYRHPFYWAGFTLLGSGRLPAPASAQP